MFLEAPPSFPVVFNAFTVGDTLFLMLRCGVSSTPMFWHEGAWHGPGSVSGENLAYRIAKGVRLLWAGALPEGLVESLVWQLRDPASMLVALDVMDS